MRWIALFAVAAALAACAGQTPVNEMPASATTAAAAPAAAPPAEAEAEQFGPVDADGEPLTRAEANAQCWMRYDRTGGTLEAKAKLVEKCANDKMAGVDSAAKKKPAR